MGVFFVCGGIVCAACATNSASKSSFSKTTPTARTTKPAGAASLSTLRTRYLAIVAQSDAASAAFSSNLVAEGSSASAVKALTVPLEKALEKSASALLKLRLEAPKAIGLDIENVVGMDNTVYASLVDLHDSYGSQGFSFSAWSRAFSAAVDKANAAATRLQDALDSNEKEEGLFQGRKGEPPSRA